MIRVHCAGSEVSAFRPGFFRSERDTTLDFQQEVYGLFEAFRTLEHYRIADETPQDPPVPSKETENG